MEDTSMSIIGIVIAAVLMFIFPLMILADRNDDISEMIVQTETTAFVEKIATKGQLTLNDYNNYVSALSVSGNNYDVEITLQILDENPGKASTNLGETTYYTVYTSQIFDEINKNTNKSRTYYLKDGDVVSVLAKNNSQTLSQSLRNFYHKVKGDDLHIIVGAHSATVTVNGIY